MNKLIYPSLNDAIASGMGNDERALNRHNRRRVAVQTFASQWKTLKDGARIMVRRSLSKTMSRVRFLQGVKKHGA